MAGLRRIERVLDRLFPKSRVVLPDAVRRVLAAAPVTVVDVGGAMGPDPRFAPLRPGFARFMMFEPDARSQAGVAEAGAGGDLVLPVGLAEAAGRRTLHLTAGPFASSLHPPNLPLLDGFAVAPWYQPAGVVEVAVDTLDAVLARHPDWRPDFVKVDVEGADLDILDGGRSAVAGAFGLQVEVSFAERNVGTPLFAAVDTALRAAGFYLHALQREHWVRRDGRHGPTSAARLMWADAVYFRSPEWLFARMAAAADPGALLARAMALLLVYGAHDTAADLLARARGESGRTGARRRPRRGGRGLARHAAGVCAARGGGARRRDVRGRAARPARRARARRGGAPGRGPGGAAVRRARHGGAPHRPRPRLHPGRRRMSARPAPRHDPPPRSGERR